jgi:hypothetical protein
MIAAVLAGRDLSPERFARCWPWAALATLAAAPYGATIGWWTSPRLALYAAVKLPLVLLATAGLTFGALWLMARLAGWEAPPATVAALVFVPLGVAGVMLASLAPVSALFTVTAPAPSLAARTTHNMLYLTHTLLVGASALFATVTLGRLLARWVGKPATARVILVSWIAVYGIVGGEVAWALRPFVGSIYEDVAFVRRDALDGNVYEFVLDDIIPHLARAGASEGGDP